MRTSPTSGDSRMEATSTAKPGSFGRGSSAIPALAGAIAGAVILLATSWVLSSTGIDRRIGHELNASTNAINAASTAAFGAALALLVFRSIEVRREETELASDLLSRVLGASTEKDIQVLPEDLSEIRSRLNAELDGVSSPTTLAKLLDTGTQRAKSNWSAEDVSQSIMTQAELIQGEIEAGYSLIRYLVWAIPSLGFIGTVLGIGEAMGALRPSGDGPSGTGAEGDPLAVAAGHLGTAFDTTLVALALSLVLMWYLHHVQGRDDALLVRATDRCLAGFARRMFIPQKTNP